MARPGVTESEVFAAIEILGEMGAKVTVESVRAELGQGSPNTINRHLRTWREKPTLSINPQSQLQLKQLKKQQIILEAELEKQREHAAQLSQLILERDQKIHQLEKSLKEQAATQLKVEKVLAETQHALEKLQGAEVAAALERQMLFQSLMEIQREQADQFREDIKAVNKMSLDQVREISIQAQDRWLEEKVKVRALTSEIEQLKSSNRSLEQKVLAEQGMNAPLRKRMNDQEKLIATCLDPKKMEAFNSPLKVGS